MQTRRERRRQRGFTLREFLVVIVILAILGLILSRLLSQKSNHQDTVVCTSSLKLIAMGIHQYESESGFNEAPVFQSIPGVSSETETARSLHHLLTTGLVEDAVVYQCRLAEPIKLWKSDSNTLNPFSDSYMNSEDLLAGTSYLLTANYNKDDKHSKAILSDRAGGAGFSANHGDTADSKGENGANVLFKDCHSKTIRNPDGYVPDSAGNESIPLWIAEPSSNASGDTAAIMGAPR